MCSTPVYINDVFQTSLHMKINCSEKYEWMSDGGKLRHGSKSDLLQCFEKLYEARVKTSDVSAVIIDDAAVMQMLKPGRAKAFQE